MTTQKPNLFRRIRHEFSAGDRLIREGNQKPGHPVRHLQPAHMLTLR